MGCSARAEALRKKRVTIKGRIVFILESPPKEVGNESVSPLMGMQKEKNSLAQFVPGQRVIVRAKTL